MKGKRKVDIPLTIVGCDFKRVATALREVLISDTEQRERLCRSIRRIDPSAGFMALETCNRVEWIVSAEEPDWMAELLKARIISIWEGSGIDPENLPIPSVYLGDEAVKHVFQVVVGLESLAVGEAQIAGQFQDALNGARLEKTSSAVLNRLGSAAGRIAKAGHRIGFRSNHRKGIHRLVCHFLRHNWPEDGQIRKVIVLGMGHIGRKTAQLLDEQPLFKVIRVNRTILPKHRDIWNRLEELHDLSREADALVIATGGMKPVLKPEHLDLDARNIPLLIMDIGVPRQTDPKVRHTGGVIYRSIDHLLELYRGGEDIDLAARLHSEIRKEMTRFARFCKERDMVLLLDRIHRGRQRYIYERIPTFVESQLSGVDKEVRRELERAMKKFIQDYAHDIHSALQAALEDYWSRK